MHVFNLSGLVRALHTRQDNYTTTERIINNLGKSNLGLYRKQTSDTTVLDSFTVTQNISELLSPACGMTDEEKQEYLAKIMAKLKSGKKLTAEEMRFLQAGNPQLYQQAARVQTMRDSFERRLANSSSREEAQTIYSDALSMVSDDDSMKEYIIAAYDDAMKEFKKSDTYQSLPQTQEDDKKNESA